MKFKLHLNVRIERIRRKKNGAIRHQRFIWNSIFNGRINLLHFPVTFFLKKCIVNKPFVFFVLDQYFWHQILCSHHFWRKTKQLKISIYIIKYTSLHAYQALLNFNFAFIRYGNDNMAQRRKNLFKFQHF